MIINPDHNEQKNAGGRPNEILLRSDIEEAQRNSNSSAGAARWLKTSFNRYKKYAQLYGIYERHNNKRGVGVDKGWSKNVNSIPLKEILEGKHPNYRVAKLKNRLVARKKIEEICSICGFNERRITDKKIPLILSFKDGNRKNFKLDNLVLLCYNCMFLTTGAPSVVHRREIEKSFTDPDKIPKKNSQDITTSDYYDKEDNELYNINISDEDLEQIRQEVEEAINLEQQS